MPVIRTSAIICTVRKHGENGAVVRLMTPEHGLQAGYVRGGLSRTLRPVLMPANLVQAELRSRSADQLAGLTVELAQSRAPFFNEPLAAAAFGWATLLTASVLPEAAAYPRIHAALLALLDLVCASPSARWWAKAMVEYERLLLGELGFGLDLSRCAVTGETGNLTHVSPRSGRAVSAGSAHGYADRLLPLPGFLIGYEDAGWDAIFEGFALTGHFIERAFFGDRRNEPLAARQMMLDRLKRVVA
ncbi:MAG: DNA repair protein RecO [Blastomonas sp.]